MLLIAAAFCVALAARAESAPMVQQPHPAVARIIAPERDSTSYGSGSLIAVNEFYGLVITNWHVVRDATGQIWVVFPGGFQSPATIMKVDRDWDLAALIVFKPNVEPLPVSTQAPLLGERLTIAGYGSGWYRAVSGRCIEYFSPGGNHPAEIVELSVPARNGDSGGPILNDRGELAGVLFGSDSSCTMGSYCGRLRRFLAPLASDFERLPPPRNTPPSSVPSPNAVQPAMIARQNPNTPAIPVAQMPSPNDYARFREVEAPAKPVAASKIPASIAARQDPREAQTAQSSIDPGLRKSSDAKLASGATAAIVTKTNPPPVNAAISVSELNTGKAMPLDELKNFLAVIGVTALLIQGLKILGKARPT